MSAHYFGNEVKETKRYKLGRLAGSVARHFLLMTATPHAGIEEDFQLFLALLDADRFEGKPRDGVTRDRHVGPDAPDGEGEAAASSTARPLFPERRAYTAIYPLSDDEALLYKRVTEYVQEEMNRAERLKAEGEGRRGAVGRLRADHAAAAPGVLAGGDLPVARPAPRAAGEPGRRGADRASAAPRSPPSWCRQASPMSSGTSTRTSTSTTCPSGELEELEEELVDQASAARTIAELEHEIATLADLEELARQVRELGCGPQVGGAVEPAAAHAGDVRRARRPPEADRLQRAPRHAQLPRRQAAGAARPRRGGRGHPRRRAPRGAPEGPGGLHQDKDVLVLVATDAAGEGINLQRAHLMVNYDLPWNPNRIEQRFGRVHRIGQTEVCHLWNLVAEDTREGPGLPAAVREARRAAQGPRRPGLRRAR